MNSLKLQLEYSNQGLKFSAFIANGEMVAYDEGFTRNGSEGIAALAYLCVCQELHTQSGLKGNCRLIPSDPNCKKLAKALSNKPQWLQNLSSYFPTRRVIENQAVAREPRISLLEDIRVVVEIISQKGQHEARYSELQMFKQQCFGKPYVTSLSIEVLPCQGGDRRIYQQSETKGGIFEGDQLWIRATANCKTYFILIWINGNETIHVLFPETSLKIPSEFESGEQKSSVLVPAKSKMSVSSDKGHEICVLIVLFDDPNEKDISNAVEAVKDAAFASRHRWSIEPRFVYSAARNMISTHCIDLGTNELGLHFEETEPNPAANFLENLTVNAISARVIIMPNLSSQRESGLSKFHATDGN